MLKLYCFAWQLGDAEPTAVTVLEYKPRQQIAVKFQEELKAGQHCVLTLEYFANLSYTYDGFYKSSYIDKDGNKRSFNFLGFFRNFPICSVTITNFISFPYPQSASCHSV